jgi:hypothetical protein
MSRRLPCAIVRAASLLTPGDRRDEWIKEWQSELWYVPPPEATRFCLGAFRDALCLRRDNPSTAKRTGILNLESPLSCLGFLALLAGASIVIMVRLLFPHLTLSPPLTVRGWLGACLRMLSFSCLFLPGTLALWKRPAHCYRTSWPSRLRRGIFLALKIALVQPIMLCGVFIQLIVPLATLAGYLPFILVLRWVISDQQQRCPVCLRPLTAPVRIGNPSRTFLDWYGAESACSHGHGLLHISVNAFSYSRTPHWLSLGDSWSGLFAGGGKRHA